MKRIILKPGEEDRILRGHPWVYENEIECILDGKTVPGREGVPAELLAGECADVESSRKQYLGRAIVNPNSKITARIYSPSKEGMDKGFFKRRIREALQRRSPFRDLRQESARLVFAEADFLPGLVIDSFSGWPLAELEAAVRERPLAFKAAFTALGPPRLWLSVQFLAWGMDSRRDMIIEALEEALGALPLAPAGIIEKSAARVRELEGLPLREGLLRGEFPSGGIVLFDAQYSPARRRGEPAFDSGEGLAFAVDVPDGQKTGHFLDQRDNRLLAGKYAALLCSEKGAAPDSAEKSLRVLDACSYTGGFGINALRAAASCGEQAAAEVSVTALDVSAAALAAVRKNAALNGLEGRITTIEADVFEFLRGCESRRGCEHGKESFDLIILDPPAFAKSRTALSEALRGYKEINLRAMKLLHPGGILITCSCSQALDEGRFRRMIAEAAADAECRLVQLEFHYQSADHPVRVGYDESLYLKCGVYRAW